MITQAILTAFANVVQFLLAIVPNIPSFPSGLLSSIDYFNGIVVGVIGIIAYLYTPVLSVFVFTAILVLLNFDNVYKLVLWFLHKVRG